MSETINNPGSTEPATWPAEPASLPAGRKRWLTPKLILAEANDAGKPFSTTETITGEGPPS
jgi:hypothetical protein